MGTYEEGSGPVLRWSLKMYEGGRITDGAVSWEGESRNKTAVRLRVTYLTAR